MKPAAARRTWLSWSSGKDSAWALETLRRDPTYDVSALVTTVAPSQGRVSIHGVRLELLRSQAEAIGLPLHLVELPSPCSNLQYEEAMASLIALAEHEGVELMAFGDLFLTDIRAYREKMLAATRIDPVFPIWGLPTASLANAMIDTGLRAVIACVDPEQLDPAFAGRQFDRALLRELPAGVDPCGERGEFHTFAYAGPMFRQPLSVVVGARIERDDAIYAELAAGP